MAQHYVVTPDGTVRSYSKRAQAEAMSTTLDKAVIATDDNLKDIPTAVLVTLHNIIRPERPVTRFSDRATAEKRMQGVLEVLAKPGELPETSAEQQDDDTTTSEEGSTMAAKKGAKKGAKKASAKRATKQTEGTVGRPSKYAGMKIVKVEKKNPRKEGTSGFRSWEVLRSGMLYEDYIAAGGVRRDLEWDLARGWVSLEKA